MSNHYLFLRLGFKWGSNPRPPGCEANALTSELLQRVKYVTLFIHILVFLLLSTHVLQIEGIKHLEISETVILPTGKGAEGLNMET